MSLPEKDLRDAYFANEIFRTGQLVEDVTTKEQMQIIDRGTNYVTVATPLGNVKKWLNEIVEVTAPDVVHKPADTNFTILESGQVSLFGYETRNFDRHLSEYILEQFDKFDDLYSKHQIIKILDTGLQESTQLAYESVDKVINFFTKNSVTENVILEELKTDIERKRIAEIIANIAGVAVSKSNYETIRSAIKALKQKYQTRQQWEVLYPFFQMAQDSGIAGVAQNLPFNTLKVSEGIFAGYSALETIEDNIDLFLESADTSKSGIELLTEYMSSHNYEFDDLYSRTTLLNKLNTKLSFKHKA